MNSKTKSDSPIPNSTPNSNPNSEPPENNFWGWVFLSFFIVGIPIIGILFNLFHAKPPH
jgi:hypothetical protein